MNESEMDKLISEIQNFLKKENPKKQEKLQKLLPVAPRHRGKTKRNVIFPVGALTLLSACAVGALTVAMVLFGYARITNAHSMSAIWTLSAAACGIFLSAMLVSSWKRLVILSRIERNTRLILASRHKTNALLEHFIQDMN